MRKDVTDALTGVKQELNILTKRLDGWEDKIRNLELSVTNIATTNESLKSENEALRNEIKSITNRLDDIEQASRDCNVEIQNMPEKKTKTLSNCVRILESLLGAI